jgi:hypothetical protein
MQYPYVEAADQPRNIFHHRSTAPAWRLTGNIIGQVIAGL